MRARFEELYRTGAWGEGSGEGSDPKACRPYIALLERFLRERGVQSVADFGCGDWQFSQRIDWGDVAYTGYDVVPAVVESCRERFGRTGVEFRLIEGRLAEVADADLLLVKDVLQHWSYPRIHAFLSGLGRFRCALVTNCVAPSGRTENRDCADGDYRPLDIREAPFAMEAAEVLTFWTGKRSLLPWGRSTRTRKSVLRIENPE